MAGDRYVGLTLDWDYDKRTVTLSMPGYIERMLQRFTHPCPPKSEDAPHAWGKPQYGAKVIYADAPDTSDPLDDTGKQRVQQIVGTLLYYGRALDLTILPALNTISTQQSKPTRKTRRAIIKLLNYVASHPDALVQFRKSDMVLHIHSDGSYLSAPKARSVASAYFFLNGKPKPDNPEAIHLNGPIHVLCKTMKQVVASAAEAELGTLFYACQEACAFRTALEEMGHPQPPTPVQTDNSTATGIVHDTIRQRQSKAMDMRFFWVRDRSEQGQFQIYWKPGPSNKADYTSKHHPVQHHRNVRPYYVFDPNKADQYYMTDVDYYAPLRDTSSDDDTDTDATAPLTEEDSGDSLSDDATVPVTNVSHNKILPPSAGEGVLISPGRRARARRHRRRNTRLSVVRPAPD